MKQEIYQIEFRRALFPFFFSVWLPSFPLMKAEGSLPSSSNFSKIFRAAWYPFSRTSSNLPNCRVPYYEIRIEQKTLSRLNYLTSCTGICMYRQFFAVLAASSVLTLDTLQMKYCSTSIKKEDWKRTMPNDSEFLWWQAHVEHWKRDSSA